jgi:hypothetical protein
MESQCREETMLGMGAKLYGNCHADLFVSMSLNSSLLSLFYREPRLEHSQSRRLCRLARLARLETFRAVPRVTT